jgi:formate dehydrogenase alpha subunit
VAGLASTLGSGAMTNSFDEIFKSDVALLTGTNTTWNHPVFASMIKRAVRQNGLKLIICDPREIELVKYADIWLQQKNGTDVALFMGLQHIILREGWEDRAYMQERLDKIEAYEQSLAEFTPERVEEITSVPRDLLYKAAKLYANADRAALYYCMGITQHSHGVDNVKACVNLQMITGNIGFEGTGVNPLRGQNNVQGACDMGGLPNVYTGYQPVINEAARKKFATYWGIDENTLSLKNGMTLTHMINECGKKIRGLYCLGENPVISDPNQHHLLEGLAQLDLLIVQDLFLTETAQLADVVLPGACFAEKCGTFTNSERRVQLSNQAVQLPNGVRQDYEIIADIAIRMGHPNFPNTIEALYKEIRDLTPQYQGISYERIRDVGIQWPCPNEDHPGTRFLHKDKFAIGKGILTALKYLPPAEEPDAEWPMRLSTGRILQHYHTGSMTRRSAVLENLAPRGYVEVHPLDAEKLGVTDGDKVRVATRRGSIEISALVINRVAEGSIFIPWHFAEAAANVLTNDALDPISAIPEYKVCAARMEKVE